MSRSRPIGAGPAPVAAAADVSTAVPVGAATSFWVHASVPSWVTVRTTNTVLNPMDETNATPIAGAVLYGPFQLMTGYDKFIHVAGDGATATIIITLA